MTWVGNTKGYVGNDALTALSGDYSWQSNQKRYDGNFAWTAAAQGPGTYGPAAVGRNLIGRMPNTPAYSPEGYGGPPIPGFSGGLLPVSASYEFLPQNTPVYLPPPLGQQQTIIQQTQTYPVSPIQQLAPNYNPDKPPGPMDVGSAVKLKFFSSPEGMLYNGLVGDIVARRLERVYSQGVALPEPVFDVRCPWRDPRTVKKEALEDKEHGHVLHSAFTADKAQDNRRILGSRPMDLPSMGGFAGQPVDDCPYIILTGIPKEKLEPVVDWKEDNAEQWKQAPGPGGPPMQGRPAQMPPIQGRYN